MKIELYKTYMTKNGLEVLIDEEEGVFSDMPWDFTGRDSKYGKWLHFKTNGSSFEGPDYDIEHEKIPVVNNIIAVNHDKIPAQGPGINPSPGVWHTDLDFVLIGRKDECYKALVGRGTDEYVAEHGRVLPFCVAKLYFPEIEQRKYINF